MILQALVEYYQRLITEADASIAPEGFERKEIPFLIVIDSNGKFQRLQDTRLPIGNKLVALKFVLPQEQERSGKNAWKKANLLWDHYGYVLAYPKSQSQEDFLLAKKQNEVFIAQIKNLRDNYPEDNDIKAVYQFISYGDYSPVFADACWLECKKIPGCKLSFSIEERITWVSENENIQQYARSRFASIIDEDDDSKPAEIKGICVVTGELGVIARLHPRTPILFPIVPSYRSKSNAKLVAFQKNSGFDSYGKEQCYNSPISLKAALAYTAALNHLLVRESTQKIQIGDATTVFWAEKKNQMENVFQELFGYQPANQENEQDYRQLLALFHSPENGVEQANLDQSTKFYVLGLAPNAARIAVRFWYAGTVNGIVNHIYQHFEDLDMVKGNKELRRIDLRSLLRTTALQEKDEKIAPNLAGDTMKSILNGTLYPQTLLASVIRRARAEKGDINYSRAALIKAILVRDTRYHDKNKQEVSMSLDITNTNPGYLLGRLFAVLERTQERANPGLNATIRDRFYGAASSTPVTAFPQLMKLKNFHIAKLENKGEVINIEKQIGEILSKLEAASAFPTHLSLQDQGRFAVGYYHQRQDFFTKKENLNNKEGKE